jgi:hypothetical protein
MPNAKRNGYAMDFIFPIFKNLRSKQGFSARIFEMGEAVLKNRVFFAENL